MARSIKKGPFVDEHLTKKVEDAQGQQIEEGHQDLVAAQHHPARTSSASRSRCTTAASSCRCSSTENMVGHKLGEFAPTRTFHGHSAEKKVATAASAPPPRR